MIKHRGAVFLVIMAFVSALMSGCGFAWENQSSVKASDYVSGTQIVSADEGREDRVVKKQKQAIGEEPSGARQSAEEGRKGQWKQRVSKGKRESAENNLPEQEINRLAKEISGKATNELTGSYPVGDDFLLWLAGTYGSKSLRGLCQVMQEGKPQMEAWYKETGKSLHVLWAEYCREAGIRETYLEKVYDKECASANQVVMDFTGDVNLAEGWATTMFLDRQSGGIRDCFSDDLWEEMQSADILMVNNEFTYSSRGTPLPGKAYTFRANPERISAIAEMGTDILSLANNHVYDYGEEALLDTLDVAEGAEIPYVGAGRNLEEAEKPVYFIANGRKIAIVSATQIERSLNYTKEATDISAGVLKTLNPDKFLAVIKEARSYSDYVIAFVHWGTENTNYYGGDQEERGQEFIDAGADVVIGGHTHCLQGFAYHNGKPIIYSLGNYWFNGRTVDTGLSQLVIHTDSDEIDFRFLPCIQQGCRTSLAQEEEKQRILDFMQRISAPGVSVGADGIVTEVP